MAINEIAWNYATHDAMSGLSKVRGTLHTTLDTEVISLALDETKISDASETYNIILKCIDMNSMSPMLDIYLSREIANTNVDKLNLSIRYVFALKPMPGAPVGERLLFGSPVNPPLQVGPTIAFTNNSQQFKILSGYVPAVNQSYTECHLTDTFRSWLSREPENAGDWWNALNQYFANNNYGVDIYMVASFSNSVLSGPVEMICEFNRLEGSTLMRPDLGLQSKDYWERNAKL